jgi:hypothetical protein
LGHACQLDHGVAPDGYEHLLALAHQVQQAGQLRPGLFHRRRHGASVWRTGRPVNAPAGSGQARLEHGHDPSKWSKRGDEELENLIKLLRER